VAKMKVEDIRNRFPRIIMNLIMTLIFWIIIAFIPQTLINVPVPGIEVNANFLVWIVGIVFMLIFLVRALADALVLVDVLTDLFVRRIGIKEERSPSRAMRDLIYIIVILLVATAVSPFLANIRDIGNSLRIGVTYIALGLVIVLIYDIGRVLYRLVEQKATALANKLAK
jgi:hypothetical protein